MDVFSVFDIIKQISNLAKPKHSKQTIAMSEEKKPEEELEEIIYKAYDIRGEYGVNLTEYDAFQIGRAFVTFTKCKKVAIGRDIRAHSPAMFAALAAGITLQGADVVDLGECSTPMSYFGNGFIGADAGIMITASHLDGRFNGFKLSRANAKPISGDTGIKAIEKIVADKSFAPPAKMRGKIELADISEQYAASVRKLADIKTPLKIVADYAFAMGIWESKAFEGLPLEVTPLYGDLRRVKKIHEANPLEVETMRDLQNAVIAGKGKYDFGVAFDADADRVGFVDENGDIIPMDISAALIAQAVLKKHPKASIGYDLRSSWTVAQTIAKKGGKPFKTRVGHAFIKEAMREMKAEFSGELSGHYYFKTEPVKGAKVYAESSSLATIYIANILSEAKADDRGATLSKLIAPIKRNFASGEINTKLASDAKAAAVIAKLKKKYGAKGRMFELDGVSIEFDTWWFNVRCSNTEPKIRLNLESTASAEDMEKRRDEILKIIRA